MAVAARAVDGRRNIRTTAAVPLMLRCYERNFTLIYSKFYAAEYEVLHYYVGSFTLQSVKSFVGMYEVLRSRV